jgi:inner membrane protein
MDSVSHACFSYLVCRGTGVARTPRQGLLAAGVALLPDLDFLFMPFLPATTRFAFHRGPSHSFFLALIAGALTTLWLRRKTPPHWQIGALVALAWTSHLLLDMCTGFGVALWWPLTHARTSFDLLFVVDPLATLPLVVAMLWDLSASKIRVGVSRSALGGLFLFGSYTASAGLIRAQVTRSFRDRLQNQGIEVQTLHAEPTPFNHQLWYVSAQAEDRFYITYRSIWDGPQWEKAVTVMKNSLRLNEISSAPFFAKMETVLEEEYLVLPLAENQLQVIDLRLGKRYGWEDDEAPFLFMYHVMGTQPGEITWTLDKPGSRYDFGRLSNLFQRVTGRIPESRLSGGEL